MSVFWMYKLKCVSREAYFNFTNYEKEKKRGGGAHCLFISRCYTKTFKWCSSFISLTSRILNFLKLEGKKKKEKKKFKLWDLEIFFSLVSKMWAPPRCYPSPLTPLSILGNQATIPCFHGDLYLNLTNALSYQS